MTISILTGLTLAKIKGMQRGSQEIVFETTCGRLFRMYHMQDCCERVDVEDIWGDCEDLIGSPITLARESVNSNQDPEPWESSTWTFYNLATNKGSVDIRWLGKSNGYYSERVTFEELDYHHRASDGILADGVYEVESSHGREWWLWDGEHWHTFDDEPLTAYQASRRFHVLGPALRRPE